jgi:SAM-dependent methyltransferase
MSAWSWRRRFVRGVYADQNDSPAVRRVLTRLLENLGADGRGLNVGGGPERLDPRLTQVDVIRHPATDCVADAARLPFRTGAFDLVVSQETIEHVADPFSAVGEMARVLRPGGRLYLQAPFVLGYHPGPEDYWRFSAAGMRELLERSGLEVSQEGTSVGAGSGLYRIGVEFFAGAVGRLARGLYLPAKALAALLCYPLKWLDGWLEGGPARDRIAGGYLAVGVKPHAPG